MVVRLSETRIASRTTLPPAAPISLLTSVSEGPPMSMVEFVSMWHTSKPASGMTNHLYCPGEGKVTWKPLEADGIESPPIAAGQIGLHGGAVCKGAVVG